MLLIFIFIIKTIVNQLEKIYDNYVRHIMRILLFLENYRSKNCKTNKLEVTFFMTPFKKILPNTRTQILAGEHVNGGYTIPCQNYSKIFIWRKEEFFKVLIHEAIHSMGIDISTMDLNTIHSNMQYLFPLNYKQTEFNLGEAYTEFWTEIINIVYYIVLYSKSKREKYPLSKMINIFDKLYFVEKIWGFTRSTLILDYMRLTYSDLISGDPKKLKNYIEKSNFFSYFIMKMLFMYDHNRFIDLCVKNNVNLFLVANDNREYSNIKKIDTIFSFIKYYYNKKELIKNYKILYNILIQSNHKIRKNNKFITILRMTCIDYL